MHIAEITIENLRCFGEGEQKLALPFNANFTAIVGENDTGKTAVIDALRFVLGTRDQEYFRVEESDFHLPSGASERSKEIRISCRFEGLTRQDKGAFAEFLTHIDSDGKRDAVLHVHWTAKNTARVKSGRRSVAVELRSGANGRLMQFLQQQAGITRPDGQQIQIIVTTHSANLASAIQLDSLVMIQGGRGFPLDAGRTQLEPSDYRFLERFLDVTKANLFFARGVVIVEGDGENILLPTLARLIGQDLAAHGVSIVNVGHTGLRRFARIFQRKEPKRDGIIKVPVACIADMDVMPDCAPPIVGKIRERDAWPEKGSRQWRAKSDFTEDELRERRTLIKAKASGQSVETFVADEWTLEYDLAFSGLAEDVWIAAHLARADEQIHEGKKDVKTVAAEAKSSFAAFASQNLTKDLVASKVYALFTTGTKASKAITAQYLAQRLETRMMDENDELSAEALKKMLPLYLLKAIDHVAPTEANRIEADLTDSAREVSEDG